MGERQRKKNRVSHEICWGRGGVLVRLGAADARERQAVEARETKLISFFETQSCAEMSM